MQKSRSFPNCLCLSLQFAGTVKEQLLPSAVWERTGAVLGLAGAGPRTGCPCPLDGASWGRILRPSDGAGLKRGAPWRGRRPGPSARAWCAERCPRPGEARPVTRPAVRPLVRRRPALWATYSANTAPRTASRLAQPRRAARAARAPPRRAAGVHTLRRLAVVCLPLVPAPSPATTAARTSGRAAAAQARRVRPGRSRAQPAAGTRHSPPAAECASRWAGTSVPPPAPRGSVSTSSAGPRGWTTPRPPPRTPSPLPLRAVAPRPQGRPLSPAPDIPAAGGWGPPCWMEASAKSARGGAGCCRPLPALLGRLWKLLGPLAAVSPPGRRGRGLWFRCLRGLDWHLRWDRGCIPACSIRTPFFSVRCRRWQGLGEL